MKQQWFPIFCEDHSLMLRLNNLELLTYSPTSKNQICKWAFGDSNGSVVNHALLLVRYTKDSRVIKNSWG